MRKINYKSDFDFILHLTDCKGDAVGWGEYDWECRIFTTNIVNAFVASYKGGKCTNCFNDNGKIHVVVGGHRMGIGRINMELRLWLPNGIYPDGTRDVTSRQPLDIELVNGRGDCPTVAEMQIVLPYIKGEPFTYADFTEEQLEDLRRPATEAAEKATEVISKAWASEEVRENAESLRADAEERRQTSESARQTAELRRQGDELKRIEAEALREAAEQGRQEAESERAVTFKSWDTTIGGKADRTELSNIIGTPTEQVIEKIEPTLVTEALRKVPQELTPQEQAQVKANIGVSKMELFVDLWNTACGTYGKYNAETGYFELNGLTDITYQEAMNIMLYGNRANRMYAFVFNSNNSCYIRTNLPIVDLRQTIDYGTFMFHSQNKLEVVNLNSYNTSDPLGTELMLTKTSYAMFVCPVLKKVMGIINITSLPAVGGTNTEVFINTSSLEHVMVKGLKSNFSFKYCPSISLASITYLIKNAANTKEVQVIVHPDVYAKLTDESNSQWHQVLAEAATKNITFATV